MTNSSGLIFSLASSFFPSVSFVSFAVFTKESTKNLATFEEDKFFNTMFCKNPQTWVRWYSSVFKQLWNWYIKLHEFERQCSNQCMTSEGYALMKSVSKWFRQKPLILTLISSKLHPTKNMTQAIIWNRKKTL